MKTIIASSFVTLVLTGFALSREANAFDVSQVVAAEAEGEGDDLGERVIEKNFYRYVSQCEIGDVTEYNRDDFDLRNREIIARNLLQTKWRVFGTCDSIGKEASEVRTKIYGTCKYEQSERVTLETRFSCI